MKTARLHGIQDLRIHDEPLPSAGAGEEVIRVTAVGVCGSDLHWFARQVIGDARLTRPLVLGHEFSGRTAEGVRVAVDPALPCHRCEFCRRGDPNLCPQIRFAGHGEVDGAMREYLAWDAGCLYPLPDSISDDEGAMLEPLGVALHAVDLAHLQPGMTVGVFGCGPVGLLIIQAARIAGAIKVIATDLLPHRVEAAQSLGADQAFLVSGSPPAAALQDATGGRGLDIAFEAAGTQAAVDNAFQAVAPGGKVLLAGIPAEDTTSFTASLARRKGLTIKLVRRMKHTYPRAIELVQKGWVDVRSLVTHHFPLEQAGQAFQTAARREGIKVIIHMEQTTN